MRVALIYPISRRSSTGCTPPLSLLYLATSLQENNFEVDVFDPACYSGGINELCSKVVDYKPHLIGIAVFTTPEVFRNVRFLCREFNLKLPKVRILVGGPHATASPDQIFEWFPEVEFVLRGESELALCQLADQLKKNTQKPNVAGLCYKSNQKIISFPRKTTENIDNIPIPNRKILWDSYKKGIYWRLEHKGIFDIIITGRGCPFNCKFCFKVSKKYRYRSPENVLEELEHLASLGIKAIHFEDDLFTANKTRAIKICRMIREARLKLNLKIRSRVDTIDEELLEEFHKTGVTSVVYGIESGSQKVLKAMGKKTSVKRNYEAIRMTQRFGFRCYADMLIGFPGETPATLEETERLLCKAKPFGVAMAILHPFPCTAVYDEAKANGTLIGDWGPNNGVPYVRLPDFENRGELDKYKKKIMTKYYSNPIVVFRYLKFFLANLTNIRLLKNGIEFYINSLFNSKLFSEIMKWVSRSR